MDAARGGRVRITNDPGSGAAEAPALAAWLPALALRLLGERLLLPSVPTMWLGDAQARAMLAADPSRWLVRSATDGRAPGIGLAMLPSPERDMLLARIEARGQDYAASAALAPSLAPCAGPDGLTARPIVLRMFLIHDGTDWRAMEGGLARVVEDGDSLAGALPRRGVSKDVWVLSEERTEIVGPAVAPAEPLPIRRAAGDLPSRVADDLFWLGRYVERLEGSARLVRAALARSARAELMPRELADLHALTRCLAHAGLVPKEIAGALGSSSALNDALLATVRDGGAIAELFEDIARLTEIARDRLTGDMYAAFTQALKQAHADAARARRSLDQLAHAMVSIMRFSATIAGVAAENMVRGGGWLFLELGRRIERARAVAADVAFALDQPAPRIEAGLRLVLELCDSVITYRTRYLTVVQAAPVLDLVLADETNPRGLAFQLEAIWHLLNDVAGRTEGNLPAVAAALLAEAGTLVQRLIGAQDPAAEASRLPPHLLEIAAGVSALSDRVTRRYFALLPPAQTLGLDAETPVLQGAA